MHLHQHSVGLPAKKKKISLSSVTAPKVQTRAYSFMCTGMTPFTASFQTSQGGKSQKMSLT